MHFMTFKEQPAKKTAELKVRVTEPVKATIAMAAEVLGQSMSDFLMPEAYARAKKVLEEQGVMILDDADRAAFVQAFLEPKEPSERLKKAMADYKAQPPA